MFPSIGDEVIIAVGDGRKMIFKILKFDGTLALLEACKDGENTKKGDKICYRLNGKEQRFKNHIAQLTLSL